MLNQLDGVRRPEVEQSVLSVLSLPEGSSRSQALDSIKRSVPD
ncbi:MAG: hypothetical protein NZM43_11945 [Saprospiraceae bacterium]|nr:hypothetical protein [Saprospiraceae bacterium]MDW8485022.1 hypothetical protein [Saprospiraceae bacterium]